MNRREFIYKMGIVGVGLASFPSELFAKQNPHLAKLTLLHTNDTHSRVLPFPKGSRYEGLGGASKRAKLIQQIRATEENVLLVDSGDIFQGTPYFNEFLGELEFKLMSEMQYDVATLGNHDFDAGIEGFVKQMPFANFPFVNANYGFEGTALENKIKPYQVVQKGDLKIGIFGLGVQLEGLVPDSLCKGIVYNEPIAIANKTAQKLKKEEKCDYIICLSHLGYEYNTSKVSDVVVAKNSKNIDLILGGHTHTFLPEPVALKNKIGRKVLINQVGWAGIYLGRLDLFFNKEKIKHKENISPVIFSKKTIVK